MPWYFKKQTNGTCRSCAKSRPEEPAVPICCVKCYLQALVPINQASMQAIPPHRHTERWGLENYTCTERPAELRSSTSVQLRGELQRPKRSQSCPEPESAFFPRIPTHLFSCSRLKQSRQVCCRPESTSAWSPEVCSRVHVTAVCLQQGRNQSTFARLE